MDPINKYFNIPSYYNNICLNIHSERLKLMFNEDPVNYLRELYVDNSEQFYNVRDELILRGISFKQAYQNNYLLDLPYEAEYILFKRNDTKAFQQINFSIMGLSNFVERFNIKSDLFFCGIPLEGIVYFSRGRTKKLVKSAFEAQGFSIVPIEEFSFADFKPAQEKVPQTKRPKKQREKNLEPTASFEKTSFIIDDLSIDKLFEDQDYFTFRRYCKQNNVKTFPQLTIDFIESFKHEKYVRVKTVHKVMEHYKTIDKKYFQLHTNMAYLLQALFDNPFKDLYEKYSGDYLSFLERFYGEINGHLYDDNFPFDHLKELEQQIVNAIYAKREEREKERFNELLQEIKEHPFYKFIEHMTLSQIQKILAPKINVEEHKDLLLFETFKDQSFSHILTQVLASLQRLRPIKEVFQTIEEKINARDLEILQLRQSKTLQEVGDIFGISRERVRQIVAKTNKIIQEFKHEVNLPLYVQYYMSQKSKFLQIQSFKELFNIEKKTEEIFLRSLFEVVDDLTYVQAIDMYMNKEEYHRVMEAIEEIGLDRPIIRIEQFQQFFSESEWKLYQEVFNEWLALNRYKFVHPIYVKENINIVERVNYLFKYVIKSPLEMNEAGFKYFKSLMEETFDMPFNSSRRSATARIADGEHVILVDRNTFYYHETGSITEEFIQLIEEEISKRIKFKQVANPRPIYEQFKDLMDEANVISPIHLYSIIQIYLDDKFEIGYGNSLNIYEADAKRVDSGTILLNYLKREGHEVKKDKFLRDFKWKEHKLDQILARTDTVLQIENRLLKTVESFDFVQEDLDRLKQEVKRLIADGYFFTKDLQFELAFDDQLDQMAKKYQLTNEVRLIAILKWLMPEIQGHSKLLYYEKSPVKKLEQAIAREFPTVATRQEIIEFIELKGYSQQTVHQMLQAIIEENYFYHYTTAQYINAEQLHFTSEVKESLANYLAEQMGENNYMSVYQMSGFLNKLQSISTYEWTEWLIFQFAEAVGYTQITSSNDYRYNNLILVKGDANLATYDRLVLHILKTEYEGRYYEKDLAKYLEAKSILHNPNELPYVVRQSPYFSFDSFGFFEIRSD